MPQPDASKKGRSTNESSARASRDLTLSCDRVGSRGQIEVELDLFVSDRQLAMKSRRIALRLAGLRMPLPPLVRIVLHECATSRECGTQRVDMRVTVPILGEIYGYRGTFNYALAVRTQRAGRFWTR